MTRVTVAVCAVRIIYNLETHLTFEGRGGGGGGGVGDFWAARNFFLEFWWAGYFFPFSMLSAPRHHGIIEQTCKLKKRTLDENGK